MPDVSVLDVRLHGESIGTLTRFAGDRILFAFIDSYIADQDRPRLGLWFKDSLGALIADFKPTQKRVLPFFSNLLPEGPLRTYLAQRARTSAEREFSLLRALGTDLPGAVTVSSADGDAGPGDVDDGDDESPAEENRHRDALRFSLAGIQIKFSAVRNPRRGLTIPAEGIGGSWIVKLPSRGFAGVPENEFAMTTLAALVGITVPEARLVAPTAIRNLPKDIGSITGKALATKRFDRLAAGGAVHAEDFAQVFGVYPEQKYRRASYANVARVIGAEASQADVAELIRRLTFNTLIGNADMHLKNWSLIYPDRRRAALAPAYDLVSTIAFMPDSAAALNFSRTKRFDGYTEDELRHLAAKALLPERLVLDTARETVALFHRHWKAAKNDLTLPAAARRAIDAHIRTLPIAR